MDPVEEFQRERPRLLRVAGRLLADPVEAEDIVQQAWMRLERSDHRAIRNLPGWLTTVVTRLCLDRLRASVPVPSETTEISAVEPDPAEDVVLADSISTALHVVLDRLTPSERVAFVLHDSFEIDFGTIAEILDCTPVAARKLASRARSKVAAAPAGDRQVDWPVVDAFLSAAREGQFSELLRLLAPDALVVGDPVAVEIGTPERIEGRDAVAEFFTGGAAAALPVFVNGRPGAAWFDRGAARVAFDFRVSGGLVTRIDFRGEPAALETIRRRRGGTPR